MIEAVGRAVSIETETINRNMDSIMEKLTALQRKIDVLEIRMDKESSRGIGMRLLPKTKQSQSYLFGSPEPALASAEAAAGKSTLGRALQCDALAFSSPILQTPADTNYYTYTHICIQPSPPPIPRLRRFETASLTSGSVTSAGKWLRSGWLLAGAG